MDRNDQKVHDEETRLRVGATLRCFGDVKEIVPWGGLNYAALRRMAARLRAGTIRPVDPEIPPDILADAIEQSIAQKMQAKEAATRRAMAPSVSAYVPASSSRRPRVQRRAHSTQGATSVSVTAGASVLTRRCPSG